MSFPTHPLTPAIRNSSTLPRIHLHRTLVRSHVGSWFRHCRLLRRKICNLPYDIIFFAVHTTAGFILTLHELSGIRRGALETKLKLLCNVATVFVVIISFERNSFWAGEREKRQGWTSWTFWVELVCIAKSRSHEIITRELKTSKEILQISNVKFVNFDKIS